MEDRPRIAAPRRPIAVGCGLVALAVFLVVSVVVFAVIFFESGADTGQVRLDAAEAYAIGSVEFIGARNFYIIRLSPREFIALSDLDAVNRANVQRRCRVIPVAPTDPSLPGLLNRSSNLTSPGARGSTLLFREACNGAVYDVTGLRLDGEGANLERYPVSFSPDGHLRVDVSRRQCTLRDGADFFAPIPCGPR